MREGPTFGGAPVALANKGNNKKVRNNYTSILFLSTNASPLISFSPVQHLHRRRREGQAFGGAPIPLTKEISYRSILFLIQRLTAYLLLSGPALAEEEVAMMGIWWCADSARK